MNPLTLAELRRDIDALDSQLIGLLARRQRLGEQAPERVAQVIADRRSQALAAGLAPEVAEAVWRAMIDAFIHLEGQVNQRQ